MMSRTRHEGEGGSGVGTTSISMGTRIRSVGLGRMPSRRARQIWLASVWGCRRRYIGGDESESVE